MLRLLGFFVATFALLFLLRPIPVIGAPFRIPLLGFFLAAIVVGAIGGRLAVYAANRAKQRRLERELGGVDTPFNRGKLGLLLLQQGRAHEAIPHLEEALEADPKSDEFRYRLGLARLRAREPEESVRLLEGLVERNEEHGYGGALLALSKAHCAAGAGRAALEAVDRHDRALGPTPESAYRRGRALRAIGDRAGAARAFASIGELTAKLPAYQKRQATGWWLRAQLARVGI